MPVQGRFSRGTSVNLLLLLITGGDFSGVISRPGPASCWRQGDSVFGLAMGSLGSHVLVRDAAMERMPPNLSFEEAAACPTVFVTVDCALRTAANVLDNGARRRAVLVHAAAGGVGLAACQLAMAHGLEPLVTAGSPAKRTFIRSHGIMKSGDSRSTGFAETFMTSALCGSTGLPVAALNSLTSPGMLQATLSCLAPGAALVEISKRDIFSHSRVRQHFLWDKGLFSFFVVAGNRR